MCIACLIVGAVIGVLLLGAFLVLAVVMWPDELRWRKP
jgi:hypothetical protein